MPAITNDMQAFVTGTLLAAMLTEAAKYRDGSGLMRITDVRPDTDEHGNYLSTFTVTFESGLRICISVSEITEIQETD